MAQLALLGRRATVLSAVSLGLGHGRMTFDAAPVRTIAVSLVLAVAALVIPTVSTSAGGPDAGHATEISVFVSVILLLVFAASIPYSLGGGAGASIPESALEEGNRWTMRTAIVVLALARVGAAAASVWYGPPVAA